MTNARKHDSHDDASSQLPHTTGTMAGIRALERAGDARLVVESIERSHCRRVAQTASRADFFKQRAGEIHEGALRAAREGSYPGGREALKGHFIEALDIKTYNTANRLAGKTLVPRTSATNPAYDASRFIDGRFAGGIQQKANADGVRMAIVKMEHVKPGSACKGTVRVPKDHVAAAHRNALDHTTGKARIRVKGMEFTSEEAGRRLDQGLTDVAKHGTKAGSQVRALAKGGAVGAAISVGLGAAGEIRALHRGDVTVREFGENRVIDAAEGGTAAIVGTLAAGAGGTAATMVITGTAAGASAAAAAGAAGTAAVGFVGGLGTGGAAVAGVLGGVTATAALPAIAGGALAVGSGLVVAKGFKRVRKGVTARQQRRRRR